MRRCKLFLIGSAMIASSSFLLSNGGNALAVGVIETKGVESRNEKWAEKFPLQYNSWKQTSQSEHLTDMLKKKPQLAVLWAGYGFAKDYNAPRGHYYALQDNINTLRTGAPVGPASGPMPTACWSCKSPDVPRMLEKEGELEFFTGKWAKYGGEIANTIGCADCHDSQTGEVALSRPFLKRGLEAIGVQLDKLTNDDMRTLVCAQCHSEYFFKKTPWVDKQGNKKIAKVVTFPWDKGLSAEAMEQYYDEMQFSDWTHKISRAPMLKAQHPGFEMFRTGIHYRRDVSCADCHMPTIDIDGQKITDHNIQNPLNKIDDTCLSCHDQPEEEFRALVETKLQRKEQLMELAMDNLAKAHLEAGRAWELGATEEEMEEILQDIRSGQWRWDYSIASHASFFHAPEETLRLLAVANDIAQNARIKLVRVLAKYGDTVYIAPDFSTKEKAQEIAGVDLAKLVEEKKKFKETLLKEWESQAVKSGILNPESRKGMSDISSYSKD
ncbi:ammonia-forming cytochrome c nitrite reductase [Desulfolithobacter sp.]